MASQRTTKFKKLNIIFLILSCLCWIGTALFVTISVFNRLGRDGSVMDIFSDEIREKLIALGTTAIIGLIIAIFIKEKIRTALYMLSLVITVVLYGETGMYIILAIWGLDEYVFSNLHKIFKQKYTINREIDKR